METFRYWYSLIVTVACLLFFPVGGVFVMVRWIVRRWRSHRLPIPNRE